MSIKFKIIIISLLAGTILMPVCNTVAQNTENEKIDESIGESTIFNGLVLRDDLADSIELHKSILKEYYTHIKKIMYLGKKVYETDHATANAFDIYFLHLDIKKSEIGEEKLNALNDLRGWITTRTEDQTRWKIYFINSRHEIMGFCIVHDKEKMGTVTIHDKFMPLEGELLAMYNSRQTAINSDKFIPMIKNYNSVVLDGNFLNFNGWIVYLLAATSAPGEIILGGHYRFLLNRDGNTILEVTPLSKGVSIQKKAENMEGLISATPFFYLPHEGHVFENYLYGFIYFALVKSGRWAMEDDLIMYVGPHKDNNN